MHEEPAIPDGLTTPVPLVFDKHVFPDTVYEPHIGEEAMHSTPYNLMLDEMLIYFRYLLRMLVPSCRTLSCLKQLFLPSVSGQHMTMHTVMLEHP